MTTNLWESTATFKKCTAEKASFVLLNYIDLSLTVTAVNFGLPELNPFARYLINIPALLIVFKIVIPLLIAWIIPGKLLWPSIALLSLVAIWNIKELLIFLF